jgi:hypothetical protein
MLRRRVLVEAGSVIAVIGRQITSASKSTFQLMAGWTTQATNGNAIEAIAVAEIIVMR